MRAKLLDWAKTAYFNRRRRSEKDWASEGSNRRTLTEAVKKDDGVGYVQDLLRLIELKHVRMHEVTGHEEPVFYLRHDGCGKLGAGDLLQFARLESSLGYSATYFLMPPGSYKGQKQNYYGWWSGERIEHDPGLLDLCQELVELGHDIGLHNDVVSLALQKNLRPGDILEREVEFFRRNGLRLRGTAAHGQPLCRELQYNNREIFSGCIRAGWTPNRTIEYKGVRVRLHSLRLEDFGFEYEAYSLPRDSRVSESGGQWGGKIGGVRIPKEEFSEAMDVERFRDIIRNARSDKVRAMQVLTHPCHWRVE